jgi:hypothetical protein
MTQEPACFLDTLDSVFNLKQCVNSKVEKGMRPPTRLQAAQRSAGRKRKPLGYDYGPEVTGLLGETYKPSTLPTIKAIAESMVHAHWKAILAAFRWTSNLNWGMRRGISFVRKQTVINKIWGAVGKPMPDTIDGECFPDNRVFFNTALTSPTYILQTLMHEALHNICKFNGRPLSSALDHVAMFRLGEDQQEDVTARRLGRHWNFNWNESLSLKEAEKVADRRRAGNRDDTWCKRLRNKGPDKR